jgi:Flp pilus assembly protein TadG
MQVRRSLFSRLSSAKGTAILETAVVLPLVVLVSIGIFEFGRAYQTWQVLTNAAREGARVAVLPNPSAGSVEARVHEFMQSGQLTNEASATVSVDRNSSVSIGSGTATASVVTVNYPFNFVVLNPIAQLVASGSALGGGPITITASAAMRNEAQ